MAWMELLKIVTFLMKKSCPFTTWSLKYLGLFTATRKDLFVY